MHHRYCSSFPLLVMFFLTFNLSPVPADQDGNSVKEKLLAGEAVFGGFVTIPEVAVVENLDLAGRLDFLWLEAEHTVMSPAQVQDMVRATETSPYGLVPLVRVPKNDIDVVKRYLGTGVKGVIFPTVNTAEEAEYAVSCTKYAPDGIRPAGVERANGYLENFGTYIRSANDLTLAVIMIETKKAAENIGEIIKVDGIDVLHLGPYDMSLSYSRALRLGRDDPTVKEAVSRAVENIEKLAAERGIPLGSYAPTLAAAQEKMKRGYRFFTIPDDSAMLRSSVRRFYTEKASPSSLNENELKAFVYHWFSLFDRQAPPDNFLPLIADKGLEMAFPEATLHSHQDFLDWYNGIRNTILENSHDLSDISVTILPDGNYTVDVKIHWKAITSQGKNLALKVRQTWELKDAGKHYPVIHCYRVEILDN